MALSLSLSPSKDPGKLECPIISSILQMRKLRFRWSQRTGMAECCWKKGNWVLASGCQGLDPGSTKYLWAWTICSSVSLSLYRSYNNTFLRGLGALKKMCQHQISRIDHRVQQGLELGGFYYGPM